MPQRPARCQPLFSFSSIFLEDPVKPARGFRKALTDRLERAVPCPFALARSGRGNRSRRRGYLGYQAAKCQHGFCKKLEVQLQLFDFIHLNN